ncbi:hypothetical protein HHK36_010051 [Tetracentron sinense]|uniref:NAD(P)-binding domain-containing protein n=1 Tax=Tetracentron sinense TaxID=13715 RepID=A0A835DLX5_TETSI|nr:hypothetical protein HHK36_010051 [Tetracentron sinense]
MELLSLPSASVTSIPSSFPGRVFIEKQSVSGHSIKLLNAKRYPNSRKLKFLDFRAQALGTTKFNSDTEKEIKKEVQSKDEGLAFVAGSTGKVGSRTVRELLKLGFRVRAGVRSAQKAETLVQSIQQMKLDDGAASNNRTSLIFSPAVEKLEIVECDLEKRDRIGLAIGNASIVLCCIGASEKEVFDITGPFRIDYQATKNLIDAATIAKVNHFILLTSLGTNKVGFPAAILNLFWGVLIWKRKAEEALIASGLPYAIVRPGGMERPTDAYKETHNILLAQEDSLFGGQVSNLQVAELMAFMAKNRSLSYCKVVEVIAETTAPLTPMGELLAKIPPQRVDISSLKESQAAGELDPPPSKSIVSEASSSAIEKEPAQTKAQTTRPLSPYFFYEDLKPPTSPTPTPSCTKESLPVASTPVEVVPLSTGGNNVADGTPSHEKDPSQILTQKTSHLSPFYMYEDLKPPTSPIPSSSRKY